ncbi:MAG: hypothetical protein PHF67_04115 [Candidatus Nanoarchaeia archaeon]|nr:hypothetical protein [Candidatus Nanoarchaeia archaeon]
MKKGDKKKFSKINLLIIFLVVFNLICAGILIKQEKVIEKDKGILYNLGKIFSFRWLAGGPLTVSTLPLKICKNQGEYIEGLPIYYCDGGFSRFSSIVSGTCPGNLQCSGPNPGNCLTACDSDDDCVKIQKLTCYSINYERDESHNFPYTCDLDTHSCVLKDENIVYRIPGWECDTYRNNPGPGEDGYDPTRAPNGYVCEPYSPPNDGFLTDNLPDNFGPVHTWPLGTCQRCGNYKKDGILEHCDQKPKGVCADGSLCESDDDCTFLKDYDITNNCDRFHCVCDFGNSPTNLVAAIDPEKVDRAPACDGDCKCEDTGAIATREGSSSCNNNNQIVKKIYTFEKQLNGDICEWVKISEIEEVVDDCGANGQTCETEVTEDFSGYEGDTFTLTYTLQNDNDFDITAEIISPQNLGITFPNTNVNVPAHSTVTITGNGVISCGLNGGTITIKTHPDFCPEKILDTETHSIRVLGKCSCNAKFPDKQPQCKSPICGDDKLSVGEDCEPQKFCSDDPDKSCKKDSECMDPVKGCDQCARCIPMDKTCDGELASESPFGASADDSGMCPSCSANCKCEGEFTKEETVCDEKGENVLNKKTVYERKIVNGECKQEIKASTTESPNPKTEIVKCVNTCQKCGKYPLLGGKILEIANPPPTGEISMGIISIENPDLAEQQANIYASENFLGGAAEITTHLLNPFSVVVPSKTKMDINFYLKIKQAFCGTKYGQIQIQFPGARYIYNVAIFMKCCDSGSAKPIEPPPECIINGALPFNHEFQKCNPEQPVSTSSNCDKRDDQPYFCRWGYCRHACQKTQDSGGELGPAIETGFDFGKAPNSAGGKNPEIFAGMKVINVIYPSDPYSKSPLKEAMEKNIPSFCQCFYDNTNEMQKNVKKVYLFDTLTLSGLMGGPVTDIIGGVATTDMVGYHTNLLQLGSTNVQTRSFDCKVYNHELAHVLHRGGYDGDNTGSGFNTKWRTFFPPTNGQVYLGESEALVEPTSGPMKVKYKNFPDDTFAQEGFVLPYAGQDIREDVASFVQAVTGPRPQDWKKLLNWNFINPPDPTKEGRRYLMKFEYLCEKKFFTEKLCNCMYKLAGFTEPYPPKLIG